MKIYVHLCVSVILCLGVISCQQISIKDYAPEPIEMNHMRVETEFCGFHRVGINGCFFANGVITQDLKVYNIAKGSLRVVGCGIDRSYRYDMKNGEWFYVELKGMTISDDCVLTLYQLPEFPGQDKVDFPVKGYEGQVFIGHCLQDQTCQFYQNQGRADYDYVVKRMVEETSLFMVRGCGVVKIPQTSVESGEMSLNLGHLNEGKGCLFYFLLRDSKLRLKSVYWLNRYDKNTVLMEQPVVVKNSFQSDASTMVYIQDQKLFFKNKGKIKDGFVRFYTSNGRSLVIEFKNGDIVWMQ